LRSHQNVRGNQPGAEFEKVQNHGPFPMFHFDRSSTSKTLMNKLLKARSEIIIFVGALLASRDERQKSNYTRMQQSAKRQRLESVYTRVFTLLLSMHDFTAGDLISCSEVCNEWNTIIQTLFSSWYDKLLAQENFTDQPRGPMFPGYKIMQFYEFYKRRWIEQTCYNRIWNLLSVGLGFYDHRVFSDLHVRYKVDCQFLIRNYASQELFFNLHQERRICGQWSNFKPGEHLIHRGWIEYLKYIHKLRETSTQKITVKIASDWCHFRMDFLSNTPEDIILHLDLFPAPVLSQVHAWPNLVKGLLRFEEYQNHFRQSYWKGLDDATLEWLFEGTQRQISNHHDDWSRSEQLRVVINKLRGWTLDVQ